MTPSARGRLDFDIEGTWAGFHLKAALQVGSEPVAVIGPNGSGKSTLLLALLGIRPAERGHIHRDGDCLFDAQQGIILPPEERHLAYLPQDFGLFPYLTAQQNVEFAITCCESGKTKAERRELAMTGLERFGISHLAGRHPHQLSGGERQRVALARAMAAQPRALLLDEPTASLDVGARNEVRRLLNDSIRELGIPTLVVTHDLGDITALAGRVAVMESGQLVAQASLNEMLRSPPNLFAARLLVPGTADARLAMVNP